MFFLLFHANIQVQNGLCSYHKPNTTEDKEINDQMNYTYRLNAAHPLLKYSTKVEITYKSKKIIVLINNLRMKSKNTTLELSKETAKELGITENTIVWCKISVVTEDEPYSLLVKPIGIFTLYLIAFIMIIFW